jgi:hypothetical protein
MKVLSLISLIFTLTLALPKTFITDLCKSDDDCSSGCCGFKSGKCAGPIIAQERDGGCGFGNATPNDTAARILRGNPDVKDAPTSANEKQKTAGKKTFITDVCTTDDDCSSGCCGFKSGKCAGPIIAQERDGGCGFGNAVSNDTAAKILRGFTTGDSFVSSGKKTFITDVCTTDGDCASGCCGFNSGKCAGPVIAQERDGGCGFGNAVPNP